MTDDKRQFLERAGARRTRPAPAALGVLEVLDRAGEMLRRGDVAPGMEVLFRGLWRARAELDAEEWRATAARCRDHEIAAMLVQDPITERSYLKPRGYPGDAVLLDLIYRMPAAAASAGDPTPLGGRINDFTANEAAAAAVRFRASLLASLIDSVAATRSAPRVLSVAAGHLREVELSAAARQGRLGELIALDQDAQSLAEVERSYACFGVRTHHASVRALITGRHDLGSFDLVYAAGLYDYLAASTASCLTEKLFALLRPGGRLLVANFLPDIPAAGYMETFMDWWLIHRSMDQIRDLASGIDPAWLGCTVSFTDRLQNVGYMLLEAKDKPSSGNAAPVLRRTIRP